MIVGTRTLIGPRLDWAVAQLRALQLTIAEDGKLLAPWPSGLWSPSTITGQGADIVFNERIALEPLYYQRQSDGALLPGNWRAEKIKAGPPLEKVTAMARQPLVAGMRCLVASHYGDTIFVPDQILKLQEREIARL